MNNNNNNNNNKKLNVTIIKKYVNVYIFMYIQQYRLFYLIILFCNFFFF